MRTAGSICGTTEPASSGLGVMDAGRPEKKRSGLAISPFRPQSQLPEILSAVGMRPAGCEASEQSRVTGGHGLLGSPPVPPQPPTCHKLPVAGSILRRWRFMH